MSSDLIRLFLPITTLYSETINPYTLSEELVQDINTRRMERWNAEAVGCFIKFFSGSSF